MKREMVEAIVSMTEYIDFPREFSDGLGLKHTGFLMIILNVLQARQNGISGSLQNMRLTESSISLRRH